MGSTNIALKHINLWSILNKTIIMVSIGVCWIMDSVALFIFLKVLCSQFDLIFCNVDLLSPFLERHLPFVLGENALHDIR